MDIVLEKKPNRNKKIFFALLFGGVFFCFIFLFNLFVAPFYFNKANPDGVMIEVSKGMGARQVGSILQNSGVIRSGTLFVALVSLLGDENKIASGTYLFKKSLNIIEAAKIIKSGDFGVSAKKITIPEGFTNIQIAERLSANFESFDKELFLNLASSSEGYLFPETYFFVPSDSEEVIFQKMIDTFDDKTRELKPLFDSSDRTKQEIIIMASILEREVKTLEDKKKVSDILWSRIKIGMALQVDATLAYERDKDSYTLTTADLRADSPYNTYTRRGLPPTPISNPGYDAILGALEPETNPYLYFLTDREGKVYYAINYSEHLNNKTQYFNK